MLILAWILACGDKGGDDTGPGTDGGSVDGGADGGTDGGTTPPSIEVAAATGDLGTAAWLVGVQGLDVADLVFQAQRDGVWQDACAATQQCVFSDPAQAVRVVTADGATTSPEVAPDSLSVSLSIPREDRAFMADELLQLAGSADLGAAPASLYLARQADTEIRWWSPAEATWLSEPVALAIEDLAAVAPHANTAVKASYSLMVGVPLTEWSTEEDMGEAVIAGLASATTTGFELGHAVLWGDPHVHSDLSQDGCEDLATGCQGPDDEPAADLFPNAIEVGLDWAAIADHAEKTTYIGSPGAHEIDVWAQQQALVQAAEGTGIVPFLGYEWTYATQTLDEDGYREGGHRTVILEETSACEDWRIGATNNAPDHEKGWSTTQVLNTNPISALTPVAMREALVAAAKKCGPQRALFIAHHPGLKRPQPVDWRREANRPDPTWETVVEIASEHGTSECMELTDPHCAWRTYDLDDYYPQGSFQAALRLGYRLGVAGGTDAHDARGGSFDDGPSCTSVLLEDGVVACQNYQGATTGVLTAAPFDRAAIFDGFFDRKTYASTGPHLPVRAWLQVGDNVYLPGRSVDAEGTRNLTVSLVEAYDPDQFTAVSIDLLNEQGDILDSVEEAIDDRQALLETVIEPGDCSACYIRIRLYEEGDAEGERIWLSPWFF